jgi:hypothetical protein
MFVTIETKGATHIAINIPHEGSDKSLPAIAAMFEQNAVFIQQGYQEAKIVKPVMAITLGESFEADGYESSIVVAKAGAVISDEFVLATPEVFVSYAKTMKREKDENSRIRNENTYLKQELEALKAKLADLSEVELAE